MKTLILSDIHANLPALQAIFDQEQPWDRYIFLGDAVTTGAFPDEVLAALFAYEGTFILGNHDLEMLEGEPLEPPKTSCNKWTAWNRRHISRQRLDQLAGFKDETMIEDQGLRFHAVHGILPMELGYFLWPDSPPEVFDFLAVKSNSDIILSGHSHIQYDLSRGKTRFINPGSVGFTFLSQPLACYAVLQDGIFDLRAVPYDIEKACRTFQERAAGILAEEFIIERIDGWRRGILPPRYFIRDFAPLVKMGYR